MPAIAVITDTDSSLPAGLAAHYGIRQVSINIHFGGETLRTGVDIDDASLYERIEREGVIPTPSAPSPGQFAEAYEAALEAGAEAIVCFCVSVAASATYSAAVNACDLFPGQVIRVVNTGSVTMGQGFMVLAAAEAAQAGAGIKEIIASAREVGGRVHLYAAPATPASGNVFSSRKRTCASRSSTSPVTS